MNSMFKDEDIQILEKQLRSFEDNTGCDLLLVVANSSDQYATATWRLAFLSSFIVTLMLSIFFDLAHNYYWPLLFFFLTIIFLFLGNIAFLKNLLISDDEIDKRTYEKAVTYFYTLGVSQISHKVTVMIMLSLLEKKIILLIDEKLKEKISQKELDSLVSEMQFSFKKGAMQEGIMNCMLKLERKILLDFGGKVADTPLVELSDHIHFVRN